MKLDEQQKEQLMKLFKWNIKCAAISGIIMSIFTVLLTPFIVSTEEGILGLIISILIGSGGIFISYGIYKKSRICSVVLLLIILADRIAKIQTVDENMVYSLWAMPFICLMGVVGTFGYHKFNSHYGIEESKVQTIEEFLDKQESSNQTTKKFLDK